VKELLLYLGLFIETLYCAVLLKFAARFTVFEVARSGRGVARLFLNVDPERLEFDF
jgi:hypothetical protein